MSLPDFEQFKTSALAEGFDEVVVREWPALQSLDTHTHAFAVKALMAQGELWLTVGDHSRHLRAGDTFELDTQVPHSERYGPQGATIWVARRNG